MGLHKKYIILILSIFLFIIFNPPVFPQEYNSKDTVQITYIGNSGFILECSGKKIAMDAFFKGYPGRYTLPGNVIRKMEKRQNPFHHIHLVLATHLHADHLKVGFVSRYLETSKKTEFVSTEETIRIMEEKLPGFILYRDRVHAVSPGWGESEKISTGGIRVTAIGLPHGRNPVQHMAFIIGIKDRKFLHLGDISGDRIERSFRRANLSSIRFHTAFIPYWYLTIPKNVRLIKQYIHSRHLVAVHLGLTGPNEDREEIINRITGNFPEAVIFKRELQSRLLK